MATDLTGQAPGGTRQRLAEVVPLATPYVVQVFPVYACNLRCNYCLFSVPEAGRGFIADDRLMDVDLFRKCVDDLAAFPEPVKVLRFVGIGEPMLHKRIADMVAYARDRGVARTLELLTNGLLLDARRGESLVAAGLDRLVISLQGTSAGKYRSVAGVDIDFDRLLADLAHLHGHRGDMHIYIKVVDTALDDEDDRQRFFDTFGPLCDSIAVERTVPIHRAIDFSGILEATDPPTTQFGLPVGAGNICPQPFFHFQINPDGRIVPCYSWDYPAVLGNAREESLLAIWQGARLRAFRRRMLDGRACASKACADCTIIQYRWFPEDDLSPAAEKLKALYERETP